MEYASPGVSWRWIRIFLTVCVVILGHVMGVAQANRQRQHRNNNNHNNNMRHSRYQSDTYNHPDDQFYENLDYEDSTVMVTPEFLHTSANVSVVEGMMATLPCAVRYLGTKQVAWRLLGAKDDHFLTVGAFTWVRENNIMVDYKTDDGRKITHWNLIIKSVKMSDQGTYQCQITDKLPTSTHVRLIVTKRPEREPAVTITGKEFVDRNEPIHLKCNATGGPRIPDEIDWFKDGTKIDPSAQRFKGVVMTKYRSLEHHAMISELIIEKTDESDTGTYICRSSDKKIVSQKVTVLVAADTTNVKRGTDPKQDGSSSSSSSSDMKKKSSGGSPGVVEKVVEMPANSPGSSGNIIALSSLLSLISVVASLLL